MQFHPAFPAQSVRIDPLHSFNRPTALASRVAALIPSETGNDPFKELRADGPEQRGPGAARGR